jgi:DNA-binding NtrC family response regulator
MNYEAIMENEASHDEVRQPEPPSHALPSLVEAPQVLPEDYECFIGVSAHVAELKEFIAVRAAQPQPTLLIGERGLRQEQIARALHQSSKQRYQPFFSVNAHGLSHDVLHNLLFGPQGVIETCPRGTIYLNELTNLSLLLQQRFAVYLEEQRWRSSSGSHSHQRLIFSTEWSPGELSAENRLAYGLIEQLRHSSFTLKPLRERTEDIPALAEHLARRIAQRLNKGAHSITPTALKLLTEYYWERNIDELEAVLESAISCTPPLKIDETLLPAHLRNATLEFIPPRGIDLPQMVDDYERTLIETALRQTGGVQTKAAQLLGLRAQTLNMKLKRFPDLRPKETEK